jgi:hypothetical protein
VLVRVIFVDRIALVAAKAALCNLSALCVSVVSYFAEQIHHRENR